MYSFVVIRLLVERLHLLLKFIYFSLYIYVYTYICIIHICIIHTHIYMNSKPIYTNESSMLGFEFICCLSNDYGYYGTTS